MFNWLDKFLKGSPPPSAANPISEQELSFRITQYFDQMIEACPARIVCENTHKGDLDWSVLPRNEKKQPTSSDNWLLVPVVSEENTRTALDYARRRTQPQKSLRHEHIIVAYLIGANEIDTAFDLISILTNEYFSGKESSLSMGYLSDKTHVLALLAFHPDRIVSQRALAIARDVFQQLKFFNHDVYEILLNFDKPFLRQVGAVRYHALVENYNRDSTQSKPLWDFITNFRHVLVGDLSLQLWEQIVQLTAYWKKTNGADYHVLEIARWLFADKAITFDRKWEILDYLMKECADFQEGNWAYHQVKIYELMLAISPDLSLSLLGKYTHPSMNRHAAWRQSLAQAKANHETAPCKKIDDTLRNIQALGFLTSMRIDAYDRYLYQRRHQNKYNVDEWFFSHLGMTSFDVEGGYFPLDYKQLYYDVFKPILIEKGINSFLFSQVNVVSQNNCEYHLSLFNGITDYSVTFNEGSDWYAVEFLLSMLNCALKSTGSELRFISVVSGDQCCQLVLESPARFFRLMDILQIDIIGVSREDWANLKMPAAS